MGTESAQRIDLGGDVEITLIHTPGHTPGSQCFLVQNRLVSRDTLVIGSCGRVDLSNSSSEEMYDSLANKPMCLDDDTVLFPGHHDTPKPTSTIGAKRETNSMCRFGSLKKFLWITGR